MGVLNGSFSASQRQLRTFGIPLRGCQYHPCLEPVEIRPAWCQPAMLCSSGLATSWTLGKISAKGEGAPRVSGLQDSFQTLKQCHTNGREQLGFSRGAYTYTSLTHLWLPRGPAVRWKRAELWQLQQRLQQQQCPILIIHRHLLLPVRIHSYFPPTRQLKTCLDFCLPCSILFMIVLDQSQLQFTKGIVEQPHLLQL